MTAQITAGVIALLLGGAILYMVRRDHLHGSYALWWLAVAAATLVLGVFPPVIDWLAAWTGISYAPVLPIIAGIGMILVRMLRMDVDRSRRERQIRRLTQRLALLEQELREHRGAPHGTPARAAAEAAPRTESSEPAPADPAELPRAAGRR